MSILPRISIAAQAMRELGPRQLGLFLFYKIGLYTGAFRRNTGVAAGKLPPTIRPIFDLPNPSALRACIGPDGVAQLIAQANDIVNRRARLFGGESVPLDLAQPDDIPHWTAYETSHVHPTDIKFIWEPARFGWAFTLGRAYLLTHDERYPQVFWLFLEEFWEDNPVNYGPNWISAQEVALRLMAFVFAGQAFARSIYTTPEKLARLAASVADHAERIPPTLIYAQAQNNNHLLSETAGLITASLALPTHPHAARWAKLGWKWFNRGLETQIAEDGTYIQQSTNYHRLMLQLALWVKRISEPFGKLTASSANQQISQVAGCRLQVAIRWLLALCDPVSGRVPNLGPNDGAYIFPFTACAFDDYRPVLQAASWSFLGQPAFETGPWDEMALWNVPTFQRSNVPPPAPRKDVPILRSGNSWAYLRAARFTSRPGHADQLHVDLWWRGLNVARDAGTYLYNAHAPWDNRLSSAFVHNTVTVNGQDQMTRAGKFLYLDWAQAKIIPNENDAAARLTARHNGYRHLGIIHQRTATAGSNDGWSIEDLLLPDKTSKPANLQPVTCTLHWLLPDWPYELQVAHSKLRLQSPYGWISIQVGAEHEDSLPILINSQLIRAGQMIYGNGPFLPILGWYSPSYGYKVPALSFRYEITTHLPVRLITEWRFPEEMTSNP
jgi:hypothetical protein